MLRRGVLTGSVLHAMAITVPIGVPLFGLAALVTGSLDDLAGFTLPGWAWLSSAGVIHFVLGRYGNYQATRALGAALSAPIQQLSVPIAVLLALLLLDEVLTPLRFLGFVLVMLGPFISMGPRKARTPRSQQEGFQPHYGEGIFWGSIAAFGYGVSPILIVFGLGTERTLGASIAGGLVSYTAAAIVLVIPIATAGGVHFLKKLDPTAGRWFMRSGIFVFVSQVLRYMSIAVAPVSVVVPIQRLSVIFRVLFSWWINRDHEVLSARVLIGIAVSLIGALALTLSTDIVAPLLPDTLRWLVEIY
jgi:uncharacterized membrane protein